MLLNFRTYEGPPSATEFEKYQVSSKEFFEMFGAAIFDSNFERLLLKNRNQMIEKGNTLTIVLSVFYFF